MPLILKHPKTYNKTLLDIKEIDENTIIVGDFNTPLKSMERSSRQKINKATEILNDIIKQIDLINIFRTLYPKNRLYILFKEHSQGKTIYWGIKLTSTNLRL